MTRERPVLVVGSPLQGWCASLDDSPDPVFRGRMLGEGVSIDPTSGELRAPFDAEVVTLPESRHAVNLRAENGAELLIHVGIDTVNLRGDGFQAHVRAGERVRYTTAEGARYIAVCLPAFHGDLVHREGDDEHDREPVE